MVTMPSWVNKRNGKFAGAGAALVGVGLLGGYFMPGCNDTETVELVEPVTPEEVLVIEVPEVVTPVEERETPERAVVTVEDVCAGARRDREGPTYDMKPQAYISGGHLLLEGVVTDKQGIKSVGIYAFRDAGFLGTDSLYSLPNVQIDGRNDLNLRDLSGFSFPTDKRADIGLIVTGCDGESLKIPFGKVGGRKKISEANGKKTQVYMR